jgi:hypothetical protein
LHDSLFANPASTGSYPVSAGLLGSCPDAWSGSANETITAAGAGCEPGDLHDLGNTIRLAKSGSSFVVSWTEDPSPDPCMAGYTVFGSADCTTWAAFSPVAEVGMTGQVTAGQGLNLEFFLVAERGAYGETGPLGHYGK